MKGKTTKLIENNTCVICKEGPVKILKADIMWEKYFIWLCKNHRFYRQDIQMTNWKDTLTITKVGKKLISETLKNCFKMKNRKPKRELNKWYTQKLTEEETWVVNMQTRGAD